MSVQGSTIHTVGFNVQKYKPFTSLSVGTPIGIKPYIPQTPHLTTQHTNEMVLASQLPDFMAQLTAFEYAKAFSPSRESAQIYKGLAWWRGMLLAEVVTATGHLLRETNDMLVAEMGMDVLATGGHHPDSNNYRRHNYMVTDLVLEYAQISPRATFAGMRALMSVIGHNPELLTNKVQTFLSEPPFLNQNDEIAYKSSQFKSQFLAS